MPSALQAGIAKELSLLLSLVVIESGRSDDAGSSDYARALARYTEDKLPMQGVDEHPCSIALEKAFFMLSSQARSYRRAFVEHCAELRAQGQSSFDPEDCYIDLLAASLNVTVKVSA